jgi:hypothetical protein
MRVNYGRQAIYNRAGNTVDCLCCQHSIDRVDLAEDTLWCKRENVVVPRVARCGAFWREPGSD